VVDAPVDRQWEGVKRVFSADEVTKGRRGWYFSWCGAWRGEEKAPGVAWRRNRKRSGGLRGDMSGALFGRVARVMPWSTRGLFGAGRGSGPAQGWLEKGWPDLPRVLGCGAGESWV